MHCHRSVATFKWKWSIGECQIPARTQVRRLWVWIMVPGKYFFAEPLLRFTFSKTKTFISVELKSFCLSKLVLPPMSWWMLPSIVSLKSSKEQDESNIHSDCRLNPVPRKTVCLKYFDATTHVNFWTDQNWFGRQKISWLSNSKRLAKVIGMDPKSSVLSVSLGNWLT